VLDILFIILDNKIEIEEQFQISASAPSFPAFRLTNGQIEDKDKIL